MPAAWCCLHMCIWKTLETPETLAICAFVVSLQDPHLVNTKPLSLTYAHSHACIRKQRHVEHRCARSLKSGISLFYVIFPIFHVILLARKISHHPHGPVLWKREWNQVKQGWAAFSELDMPKKNIYSFTITKVWPHFYSILNHGFISLGLSKLQKSIWFYFWTHFLVAV